MVCREPELVGAAEEKVVNKRIIVAGAGGRLGVGDVLIKRPGTGISPADLDKAIGRPLARDIAADEVIGWEALAEP